MHRGNEFRGERSDKGLFGLSCLLGSAAMLRSFCLLFLALECALAAERTFDFTGTRDGELPAGFKPAMTGRGTPGTWRVIMDEVPLVLPPFSSRAPVDPRKPVVAQLSRDKDENRALMLLFEPETFSDFSMTTRIKIVSGEVEQMAGIAFRVQNERNYYYIRLNALNKNVAFFRYVDGELIGPVSAPAEIKAGQWSTLTVESRGNKLRALIDEKEVLPWTEPNYVPLPDGTSKGVFGAGKIGFWTKADTVAHFAEARMVYTPREPYAQVLIRESMKQNPRLLGLKLFAVPPGEKLPKIVGSDKDADLGQVGEKVEIDCLEKGGSYSGKGKEMAVVTMPLHDRNGEIAGVVRVEMTTFLGQTEKNMLARALPIVKSIEQQIGSSRELFE